MQTETPKDEPIVTSSEDMHAAPEQAKPATEQNPSESTADSADGEQAPETQTHDDDKAPLPKGVQRKINKLTRKAGDAERTARELQLERDLLLERLKHHEPPKQEATPTPQKDDGKPTLEAFDYDQDAYLEALADWRVDKRLAADREQAERTKAEETARERATRLQSLEASFIEANPDYEEVAKDPTLPITSHMAEAMMDTEIAPAIAYYLGQHRDEAASIAQLSPVAQGRAIGRIEAKLSAPASTESSSQPPRRIPTAPAPPTTLNAAAPITKSLADIEDMGEYIAERNRQRTARGLA